MLDKDLADLYGVETKVLKQAVKRNKDIFSEHFMFELTQEEFLNLRSQFVTSSWGGERYLPFVDDGKEWIEPGLGAITGKDFSGKCYLGDKTSKESINKQYKIYAIVSNTSYTPYEHLQRESVIAQSDIIELYRTH